MTLEKHITQIPAWRRAIICVIQWSKWKTAKAYNVVAVDLLHGSDWNFGNELRKLSDYKWADIYGYEMPPREKRENFEKRAISAEIERDSLLRNIAKLERQLELAKNTMRGLTDLRRQRTLPLSNAEITNSGA